MRAAYYALHYGKEYLEWSIRSIHHAVDAVYIFYSDRPSYGFSDGSTCPDTEEELRQIAGKEFATQVIFLKGEWHNEHEHREHALERLKGDGFKLALVVDADEVWPEGHAQRALDFAQVNDLPYIYSATFHNFWRSFQWRVLDSFRPIRVVDLRHRPEFGSEAGNPVTLPGDTFVLHFGYAQSEAIMRYKWTCHGHQRELKPGWIDRFCQWQVGDRDLHPVVNGLWDEAHLATAEDRVEISKVLGDHPYYGLPIIR